MLHSAFCTVAFTSYGHSVWDRRWKTGLATHHPQRSKPSHSPLALHQTFPLKDPPAIATPRPSPPPRDNWWKNAISGSTRPTWSERVPEVVPGFPDRIIPRNHKAAAILKTRTLRNLYNMRGTPEGTWLDNLHRTLDEAVAAAYGWPADLPDDEVLSRLLDLNRARARQALGWTRSGKNNTDYTDWLARRSNARITRNRRNCAGCRRCDALAPTRLRIRQSSRAGTVGYGI
jgi:hypothetical protein